jgi:hypothetical protein
MIRHALLATGTLALFLGGCVPPAVVSPSGSPATSYFPPLNPCPGGLHNTGTVFTIDVPNDALNVNHLPGNPHVTVLGAPPADASLPPDPHLTGHQTRWDLNTPSMNPNDAATIEIVVAPGSPAKVRLRGDALTIRYGDDNGVKIFCGLNVMGNVASFTVYRPAGTPPGTTIYGRFDIGLQVDDDTMGASYTTPIYIDPNVKNNG